MKIADKIKVDVMRTVRSHAYDIVIPNYYVGGYEMDVFKLSRAHVLTEYEIKISRGDFFADFDKKRCYHQKGKHDRMIDRSCLANKFFYVFPEGLIKESEVPDYAGIMAYEEGRSLRLVRNAPMLHRERRYSGIEIISKLSGRCAAIEGKLRYSEYRRRELEKRVESLKQTIRKVDPKNIQLFF